VVCCRVDQHKQLSIHKKIASLCAADVALKEFAQRVTNDFYVAITDFSTLMLLFNYQEVIQWSSEVSSRSSV